MNACAQRAAGPGALSLSKWAQSPGLQMHPLGKNSGQLNATTI